MSAYHLAQLNIAKMKADIDDPIMRDFVDKLEDVNSIADNSPGFVWRLQTDTGDATDLRVFEDNMLLVNMSVWESVEDLKTFVYETFHLEILKRKKEWFDKFDGVYQVMWWVKAGRIPDVDEARARLSCLQEQGVSELAFNFQRSFPPAEQALVLPAR
jgi:hypothetical protein